MAWRVPMVWLLSLALGLWPATGAQSQDVWASQPDELVLGVMTPRTRQAMEPGMRLLAEHLSRALKQPVKLRLLDQEAMESALQMHRLDLVLTNPSHYQVLRSTNAMTGALATVVRREDGRAVSALGGVILARSERNDLDALSDLRGKTVAFPGQQHLGGFQAQAFELHEVGVPLRDLNLVTTDSHDSAILEVLAGTADVAFVRTGMIESMVAEGSVPANALKVLNDQRLPSYPYKLSTRLYPEWPLLALPHVHPDTARRVASAVLQLDSDHPAMRAAGLNGFTVAADYLPVENLARTLRLPPFDQAPAFTLTDILAKHQASLSVIAGLLVLLATAMVWQLRTVVRLRRSLADNRRSKALQTEQRELLSAVMDAIPTPVFYKDNAGRIIGCNTALLSFLQRPEHEVLGKTVDDLLPAPAAQAQARFDSAVAQAGAPQSHEAQFLAGDGQLHEMEVHKSVFHTAQSGDGGMVGVMIDITKRKRNERALQLAASVFTHAQEGIMITDAQSCIVDVNHSFTRITGYEREEVLGRNPSLLSSGRQTRAFYAQMWSSLKSDGEWHGELWNRRKDGQTYAQSLTITALAGADGAVLNYVAVFTDITAVKEHQKQLEFTAHYDPLTQLPNRSLLADRLRQAMALAQRHDVPMGLVFLDLDGFKEVNDHHGHDVGDQLLQTLGQRLKNALREGDTLARLGGDEFVAVLTHVGSTLECERVLQRMLDTASAPIDLPDGVSVQVSASLGVALYPQDGTEADTLLRHADQAMYQAKQEGKNRYHLFDANQDDATRQRRQHTERVLQALQDHELALYYQPKVDMRAGAVVGAEALIRWHHPERGLMGPADFLPGIEDQPASAAVGDWVIRTALAQQTAWVEQGLHLPVSVNISAYHLQQPGFADRLQALLAEHPSVAPTLVQLEILETSALQDMATVVEVMARCRQWGVAFALDDFGTGYSSLTYLKRLPAEVLKIDQSFVRHMRHQPDDLTIVEGVVSLATAFGRGVIAEGVETEADGDMLLRLGCDMAQGYAIARPMPATEVPTWVAGWQQPDTWAHHRHTQANRQDLPMVFAEVEHQHWLHRVLAHAHGESEQLPDLDAENCPFEHPHGLDLRQHLGHLPGFDTLQRQHATVHTLGKQLVDHSRLHGQPDPALEAQLCTASEELLRQLRACYSP